MYETGSLTLRLSSRRAATPRRYPPAPLAGGPLEPRVSLHLRLKIKLKLFAGISTTSASRNPDEAAASDTASRSRRPHSGSCARRSESNCSLLLEVCCPKRRYGPYRNRTCWVESKAFAPWNKASVADHG